MHVFWQGQPLKMSLVSAMYMCVAKDEAGHCFLGMLTLMSCTAISGICCS